MSALVLWCGHDSWTGGEGPADDLGRSPILWSCDGCSHVEVKR